MILGLHGSLSVPVKLVIAVVCSSGQGSPTPAWYVSLMRRRPTCCIRNTTSISCVLLRCCMPTSRLLSRRIPAANASAAVGRASSSPSADQQPQAPLEPRRNKPESFGINSSNSNSHPSSSIRCISNNNAAITVAPATAASSNSSSTARSSDSGSGMAVHAGAAAAAGSKALSKAGGLADAHKLFAGAMPKSEIGKLWTSV